METVNHQFLKSKDIFEPQWDINYLFLGTFNPDCGEKVNYFYGRRKNQTWGLLSEIFREDFNPEDFDDFYEKIRRKKIACMDMIRSVKFPAKDYEFICTGYSDSKIINKRTTIEYNTYQILTIIDKNKEVKVYSTWGKGPQLKRWKEEIAKIPSLIPLMSPSPRAAIPKDIKTKDWKSKLKL